MTASLPLDIETADRIQALIPLWLAQPNARAQRESIIRGLKPLVSDPALRTEVQRRAIDLSQLEADRKFWADPVGATDRKRQRAYKSLTLEQIDPKRQRLKLKVTPPELVWCAEATTDDLHLDEICNPDENLEKGSQHKYLKRVPTGKQRPKYRYYYKLPKTKGLTSSEDIKVGAKVKVSHSGQVGHFEILGHDTQKGIVRVKHDESGRTARIREGDLHRMVQSYHRAKVEPLKLRTQSTQARLPGTKAPGVSDNPPSPPRQKRDVILGTLGDLTSGVYDQIEGFGTESQVRAIAEGLSADRRYAVIQQPGGWVLASGAKHEPMAGGARPGNATDLFFRGTGRRLDKYQGQWMLVEADELVASHDPVTFSPRADYPKDVQERAYHDQAGEQEKVVSLSQTLEPAMLVNDNPDAVNGAPIAVELDGKLVVLGGNGRTMGVQRAYRQDLETAAALKRHLATRAHAYGFSAADVRRLKAPMLVRRMTPKAGDTADLRTLGRRMNESFTQGLDARAEEVALGKAFVNRDVLDTLTAGIGDDQTLADYLASGKSRDFVAACMRAGLIDDRNKTKFVDQRSGLLNEDGRARIERVLAARLVPDASLLNRMMPSVREHLARSTAALVAAESNGWDLKAPIEAAVRADIDLRARRGGGRAATRDYLAQLEDTRSSTVATRVQTDPTARAIFVALRHYGGATKTPAAFRGVALRARQASVDGGALGLALPGFSREPEQPDVAIASEFGIGSEWMGQERLAASLEVASWRKAKEGADLEQPNRAVNRAAWLTRALVDAHTGSATGAGEHPTLPVAVIVRAVLRDLRRAVKVDPELAADLARSPVTESTIRGFLEVFARQHAQTLAKALGRPVVRMALGERSEDLYKRVKVNPDQMDLLSWRAVPEVTTTIDASLPAMSKLHGQLDWLTRQFVDPWDLQEWAPAFKTHEELAAAAKLMVEVGQREARSRDAQSGELPDRAVAATFGSAPPALVSSGGQSRAQASGSITSRPAHAVVVRPGQRPPGGGWGPIPGGRKGGFRRRRGNKWEYWYPENQPAPTKPATAPPKSVERQTDVTEVMSAKRTKTQRKEANDEALQIVMKAAAEGRGLTDAEAVKVAKYTGKGGISGDLNQFYTRTDVAAAMWDIIGAYQDRVDRVLEPSCGSGVFLQTAPKGTKVTGVELDPQAAAISQALHGHKHEVEAKAFEEFTIEHLGQDAQFDAVIANPPYCVRTGDIPRHKPEHKSADHYFIDTSLDHVKPGGVCAFLIHPGVLNNKNQTYKEFRERLLARAEVLDAFRLPDDTFKHVHCEISADILIIRKRDDLVGQTLLETLRGDEGAKTTLESLGAWDQGFIDGAYFDTRPERILGRALSAEETGWRATVEGDVTKVPAKLRELTEKKIAGNKDPAAKTITREDLAGLFDADPQLKDLAARAESTLAQRAVPPQLGNVEVIAGQRYLYIGEPPRWRLMETVDDVTQIIDKSGDAAVKDASTISDDIAELIKARDEGDFYKARSMRRATADRVKAWVAENGIPRSHRSLAELSKSAPKLLDFLACVDTNGELSDVLSKDAAITLKAADVDRTDILSVARHIAARNAGYVSVDDIQHNWEGWDGHGAEVIRQQLLGSGEFAEDTLGRTSGLAPLQHVEDYLTGNLYDKLDAEIARLEQLEAGSAAHAQVQRQIGMLRERLQTKWRSLDDTAIQLRVMGWLPLKYFDAYLNSPEGRQRVLGKKERKPEDTLAQLTYDKGVYTLHEVAPPTGATIRDYSRQGHPVVDVEPGKSMRRTSDGYDFLKYMNRLSLKRERAQSVEHDIEDHFSEWLKESEYRTEVEELYNRTFNAEFRREYSGEALPLEGIAKGVIPHDYQNQAVRWAAETGRGILGQDVGLGKTFIAILLARLRKQQGRAKRPMVVVPKSVATNWAEEVQTLFPGSRVLVIGEHRNKSGGVTADTDQQRNEKLAAIRQNEYDLIICTKPAFDRIPLRHETIEQYEKDDFWYQRAGQIDSIQAGSKTQQTADKRIEKLKASWAQDKLQQKFRHQESLIYWEDIGIDTLMADEAHSYKNLYAARSRYGKNPKFLGGSGQSKTARKMQHMSRFVRDANPQNGVYLLTATPTKNSPLEVFNMLQHVAPESFRSIGIENSEQFIDRFCRLEERLILTPPGKGGVRKKDDDEEESQYRDEFEGAGNLESAQCVTGFSNLKELEQIMDRYMLLQTATDVGLALPESQHETHLVDMTAEQKAIYAELRDAARKIKKDDPGGMFRTLDLMKKAAQDLGLYDQKLYADWYVNSPKYRACVEQAFKGATERGGQIIFCDHNASHERIKAMLVAKGLKDEEIGIINAAVAKDSAARQQIGNAFNAGEIKVVIGNTGTMGEGVNLQGKKHARGTTDIHHLDQPWDPGTMHQRNGRGVRQGNRAEQVQIHTYLAKGSFDGFRHSTLKGKERWLDKLRSGADNIENSMEGQDLDDAEMLAMLSDDPEAAMAKIRSDRASAENAWYVRQAQESIDTFYGYQRKLHRLIHLKGQEETRSRLTADLERIKRQLMRNELLPAEIKAHLESGDSTPVAVSTYVEGEGDTSRFAARLVKEGSVIASTGGQKYVVQKVDLKERTVTTRHWGASYTYDVPVDKIGQDYKATTHTPVDELREALKVDDWSAKYKTPIERVDHIAVDVLIANRDLLDAAVKEWYAEHGAGQQILVGGPEGVRAVDFDKMGDAKPVYPWGEDREALVAAIAVANEGDRWSEWTNDVIKVGKAEFGWGYSYGRPSGHFRPLPEEAAQRWEAARA